MNAHHVFWLCGGILAGSLLSGIAQAAEPGLRRYVVPASAANPEEITVVLSYPTQSPAREVALGPITVRAAIGAPPDPKVKGLIVLSHGTGGSELGHNSLAEALARAGYLVAALRHPGDNYLDRSLWQKPRGAFFTERPRQATRLIDALLGDPEWKDRIANDARGPRVGVLGHSAGGYTAVALVGGRVDLSRIRAHCGTDAASDPLFCGMSGNAQPGEPARPAPMLEPASDARVRAIAVVAPLGVMFTAESLAAIKAPTLVYAAENDRWLVPRFHAAWIARNIPGSDFRAAPMAWHFAFMDKAGVPIQTLDGDANADPPGFDRAAFLSRLRGELVAFFDKALGP